MIKSLDIASEALSSKVKGDKWVLAHGIPALAEVTDDKKSVEASKVEAAQPHKDAIKEINDRYKGASEQLSLMDDRIRERIVKEHTTTDTLRVEGVGECVFPESWTYVVEDEKIVPKELKKLVVDDKEIRAQIKNGVRNIKGIRIYQERSLRFTLKR